MPERLRLNDAIEHIYAGRSLEGVAFVRLWQQTRSLLCLYIYICSFTSIPALQVLRAVLVAGPFSGDDLPLDEGRPPAAKTLLPAMAGDHRQPRMHRGLRSALPHPGPFGRPPGAIWGKKEDLKDRIRSRHTRPSFPRSFSGFIFASLSFLPWEVALTVYASAAWVWSGLVGFCLWLKSARAPSPEAEAELAETHHELQVA